MKKVLYFLTIIVFCLTTISVKAASFNTKLNGTVEFEGSTSLKIDINSLDGFVGGCGGLCGLTADLVFDSSKIGVEVEGLNGFKASGTEHLVIYKSTGITNGSIATIKITNKTLKNGETATIALTNVVGSDGDSDIDGNQTSALLKIKVSEPTTTKTTTTKKTITTTTKPTTTTTTKVVEEPIVVDEENPTIEPIMDPTTTTTTKATTTIRPTEKENNGGIGKEAIIISTVICVGLGAIAFVLLKGKK